MAYQNGSKKEHAFVTIGRDIKEGGFPNLLLLCGEETYLMKWALDLLVSKTVEPAARTIDYSLLDGKEITWNEIMNQCETWPMLSSKRVVAVSDFTPGQPKETLEDFLHLPEHTLLIFLQNGACDRSKKTGLAAMVAASGKIYEFEALEESQLKAFIQKRLKSAGVVVKPSVLSYLITSSGYGERDSTYNLFQLENDLTKMIAHRTGDELTLDDVKACLSETIETNTFAMLDAIAKNRKEEAFRLLHDMFRSGENVYRLLSTIATQMELMLCVKELRQEGRSPLEIKGELNVHELRIKKALAFSEKFSVSDLKGILMNIYKVDKQIKSGVLESEMALEMMIAEI
jgi:DNA polymerase III subunit delta